jgi:hypothetical protein
MMAEIREMSPVILESSSGGLFHREYGSSHERETTMLEINADTTVEADVSAVPLAIGMTVMTPDGKIGTILSPPVQNENDGIMSCIILTELHHKMETHPSGSLTVIGTDKVSIAAAWAATLKLDVNADPIASLEAYRRAMVVAAEEVPYGLQSKNG